MRWQAIQPNLLRFVQYCFRSQHNRIVSAGLLVVALCYLPIWLKVTIRLILDGSLGLLLNSALIFLGVRQLWQCRTDLARSSASLEDRIVGYLLMGVGVAAFFGYNAQIFAQVLSVAMILVGAAYSCWGLRFFYKYWLPALLLLLSVHPNLSRVAYQLWLAFTPPDILEQWMAAWGSRLLNVMGQPAIAQGRYILLASSGVEVAPGCSGFEMAFTVAAVSLVFGMALKSATWRTMLLTGSAIALALVCNVPRIMLMTLASVY